MTLEFQHGVEALYAIHAERICDDELEAWTELYTPDCLYKLTSRLNHERGLPLSPILAESQGALSDRVAAIRNTMVWSPRCVTHTVSGIRIVKREGNFLHTRSMFAVFQTMIDGTTMLHMVGRTFDKIAVDGISMKFAERVAIYDSELVLGSVIYPI